MTAKLVLDQLCLCPRRNAFVPRSTFLLEQLLRTFALVLTVCLFVVCLTAAVPLPSAAPELQTRAPFSELSESVEHYVEDRLATLAKPREVRASEYLIAKYKMDPDLAKTVATSVYQNADELGLDPMVIFGLIHVESRFDPNALSSTGAMGFMQIIPSWHVKLLHEAKKALPGTNIFTPATNIWIGARIKKQYLDKFKGQLVPALSQYNGSLHDQTRSYYHKVRQSADQFQKALS